MNNAIDDLESLEKGMQVELAGGRVVDKQDPREKKPVSKFYDPLFVLDFLNFKSKNTNWALSYQLLRKISYRNGIISSIINTRINQISLFSSQYLTPNDRIGYSVFPKNKKYSHLFKQSSPNIPITPINADEVRLMQEIMEFLEGCGTPETREQDPGRGDFGDFLKKIVRDSLTFDQLCFEIVKDPMTGKPIAFYPVDAGTIRIADPKTQKEKGIHFVQYLDGIIYAAYKFDEMAFAVRNPTTDVKTNGYGVSEIEQALNYISSQMNSETYNAKFFQQGSAPKGLINIRGSSLPQEELDAFRRAWHAQIAGVSNAWKTPIIAAAEGLEWINLGNTNREMEFSRWLEYLVNVICAVFQIDPVEINFPNRGGASSTGRSLSDSSAIERIKFSKDKGLVPLLKFLEKVINRYIVYPLSDNKFEFSFYGYTDVMDAQKIGFETQEVGYLRTVNEIRAQYGLAEITGGDIILNPTYVQYKMQKDMLQQQAEMMAQQTGEPPPNSEESSGGSKQEEQQDSYTGTAEPDSTDSSDATPTSEGSMGSEAFGLPPQFGSPLTPGDTSMM